jgi:putative membrane protein
MGQLSDDNYLEEFIELFLKAIPIGMSNTLPGISGGTMALVLKIYDRLISGIKRIKIKVLVPVLLGAVFGVGVGAKVVTSLLKIYPGLVTAFLLGLILASSKVTFVQIKQLNWKTVGLFSLGLVIALVYSVDSNAANNLAQVSLIKILVGGAIGSTAMILPGISGGTVLIMLGLYERVLTAISAVLNPVIAFRFAAIPLEELKILIIFAIGVGSGLLLFSWLLSYLLNHFRSLLMASLTGLILGSMRSVLPNQLGIQEVIGFLLGLLVIYVLDRY